MKVQIKIPKCERIFQGRYALNSRFRLRNQRIRADKEIDELKGKQAKLVWHLENLTAALKFGLFFLVQTYLAVSQVAGRIWSPGIAEVQIRTNSETAAAAFEKLT